MSLIKTSNGIFFSNFSVSSAEDKGIDKSSGLFKEITKNMKDNNVGLSHPILGGTISNFFDTQFNANYFIFKNNKIPKRYIFRNRCIRVKEIIDFFKSNKNFNFITYNHLFRKDIQNSDDLDIPVSENIINDEDLITISTYINKEENIIVYFDTDVIDKVRVTSEINILFLNEKDIEDLVIEIKSLETIKRKTENKVHTIISNGSSLDLISHNINFTNTKTLIFDNYNDDFLSINKTVLNSIKNNKKGLILFHGEPGCGKTSYIRYLTTQSNNRKVIFVPPNMGNELSSPSFINFLVSQKNSILIIEDAENILKSRKSGQSQSIANILNLSDGLLSDILNILIIATFNCDLENIDQALLRKGRLLTKYEFRKLDAIKAQKLSASLGNSEEITKPMSLADIYNKDDNNGFAENKSTIGFTFNN